MDCGCERYIERKPGTMSARPAESWGSRAPGSTGGGSATSAMDGVDGVHPRRQRGQRGRPIQVLPEVERLVLSVAISTATWGCARIAAHLRRTWQLPIAPSTVQRLLRRVGLDTRRARLTVLEQQAARTCDVASSYGTPAML